MSSSEVESRRGRRSIQFLLDGARVRRQSSQDMRGQGFAFPELVNCPFCKGQVYFCTQCAAKFEQKIPSHMLETVAFSADDEENAQLYSELLRRVCEHEKQNSRSGGTMRSRQAQERVMRGLEVSVVAQNLARNKRENAGLLVQSSPLDAMPSDFVGWLASIDGETRSWMRAHNERIRRHTDWLSSEAIERVYADDQAIDVNQKLPGLESYRDFEMPKTLGKPAATAKLPPTLHELHARIEARARHYCNNDATADRLAVERRGRGQRASFRGPHER